MLRYLLDAENEKKIPLEYAKADPTLLNGYDYLLVIENDDAVSSFLIEQYGTDSQAIALAEISAARN